MLSTLCCKGLVPLALFFLLYCFHSSQWKHYLGLTSRSDVNSVTFQRHWRCSIKKEACNFMKKETLAQVFSCEFCKIFKNSFFTENLRVTASNFSISMLLLEPELLKYLFFDKTIFSLIFLYFASARFVFQNFAINRSSLLQSSS